MSINYNNSEHVYLILCHNNVAHLTYLIDMLSSEKVAFLIHVDKKSNLDLQVIQRRQDCFFLDERVEVFWGTFSMVDATLKLLDYANVFFKESRRFTLLSGSCFPVRSKKYINEFFLKNDEIDFFNYELMKDSKSKPISRVKCYIPEIARNHRNLIKTISKIPFRLWGYPLQIEQFYCGSQWFSITKATYLNLKLVLNKDLLSFFKKVYIPDEVFFQTIFIALSVSKKQSPAVTFADWSDGLPSPAWLDTEKNRNFLVNKMQKTENCIFVRKVNIETQQDFDDWVTFVEEFSDDR